MLRLAPLRRSLLRRALLASRPTVTVVTPHASRLRLVNRRAIHTTRALLETTEHPQATSDDGKGVYLEMAIDSALRVMPLVILGIAVCIVGPAHVRVLPSQLVKESFTIVAQNEVVTARLGTGLFAYGDYVDFEQFDIEIDHDQVSDSSSLRDECISHTIVQPCGSDHIKLAFNTTQFKYNIKGSEGRAVVYAQVQNDKKDGQYVYLIVTFVETGEVLEIIDNRAELAASVRGETAATGQQ